MLDRDLAELYGVEVKHLNRQVRRNIKRFPEEFCFQVEKKEFQNLKCHFGTSRWGGRRKPPIAFTEYGVAALSGVLKGERAIEVNIKIIRAFVEMRHFIQNNANIFQKFQQIDQKLLTHDENFNQIFKAIESKQLTRTQGIFYDGQIYDAYKFIKDLVNSANESIILIDNYINEDTLTLLSNKNKNVKIKIYTKKITKELKLAQDKFNQQYGNLEISQFTRSHDRFLIIDNQTYHIGSSLKDAGKKWFAFSKMNLELKQVIPWYCQKKINSN